VLECELERLEVAFATSGAASDDALDLYQRTSGGLRRLLETLGLKRRPRTIVPSVEAYIAATANEPEPEEVVE
jgi:hypothetical protein